MMQDFYNIIARHLLTQNSKAMVNEGSDNEQCVYRAPDGKKCAFGVLIPDTHYDPCLEGSGVLRLLGDPPREFSPEVWTRVEALREYFDSYEYGATLNERTLEMLVMLQRVHDGRPTKEWRIQLSYIAGKFGLDMDVVLNFWPTPHAECAP